MAFKETIENETEERLKKASQILAKRVQDVLNSHAAEIDAAGEQRVSKRLMLQETIRAEVNQVANRLFPLFREVLDDGAVRTILKVNSTMAGRISAGRTVGLAEFGDTE